jgi:PAS domain S-box-containing protein
MEIGTGTIELELICKDGHKIPTEYKASAIKDEEGKPKHFISIGRDITDRKRVEVALKKERDRSQQYLDVAGVMFVAIDTEQNVVMINKKGCKILGYEEHEIVGKNWFDHFIKTEDIEEIKRVFNQIVSGDIEPVEYYENTVFIKGGYERIIAWHNSLVRDESGRIIGTLSSGDDITERKRAEEELARHRENLEKLVEER